LLPQLFKFLYIDQMYLFQARRTSRKSKALVWFVQTVCRRGEGTDLPEHLIYFSYTRYKFTVNAYLIDFVKWCTVSVACLECCILLTSISYSIDTIFWLKNNGCISLPRTNTIFNCFSMCCLTLLLSLIPASCWLSSSWDFSEGIFGTHIKNINICIP
jgi:hypothetical protein